MKNPMKHLFLALAFVAPPLCLADTILLKDGTKLEGTILSKEDDHYVALIQYTKSIREQRKIPKADVVSITTEEKDKEAYESVLKLVPVPELAIASEYETRIDEAESFLKDFPESIHRAEVRKVLKTLQSEHESIKAGSIKFGGDMIPVSEQAERGYVLDSQIAAKEIRDLLGAGRRVAALRKWRAFDEKFPASQAYIDLAPVISSSMKNLLSSIERSLETLNDRLAEREKNIMETDQKDRARTKRIIEEEAAKYQRKVQQEKEAGIDWLTLDPYHGEPMKKVQALLKSNLQKLDKVMTNPEAEGDAAWDNAWKTLSNTPSKEEAKAALDQAKSANLPDSYLNKLQALAPE